MVMQFGQFVDHDLTLTPESEADDCCTEEALSGRFAPGCFPILFADSDSTFANLGWIQIAGNLLISQKNEWCYFLWSSFSIAIQQIMIYIILGIARPQCMHKSHENYTFRIHMQESNFKHQRTVKWYHGLCWCFQCLWIRVRDFYETEVFYMKKISTRSKLQELYLTNISIKLKDFDWWTYED